MNNIGFLWFLLMIFLIMVYYFIYINDIRSLLLLVFMIVILSLCSDNMNLILFLSLLFVSGFNILGQMTDPPSIEYHIWSKQNYKTEEGITLKENTTIEKEPMSNLPLPIDLQEMIDNWNKLRPSID